MGRVTSIRWCESCQLGFTDPRPDVDYSNYTYGDRDAELWRQFAADVIRFTRSQADGPLYSWLDFGAGSGDMVLAAKRAGLCAIGVEIDPAAQAAARARNVTLVSSVVELANMRYDVISLSHVLEHLEDPGALLTMLRPKLTPKGLLVVVQPDCSGALPRLLKDRWGGWVPEQHLWHFTPASMRTLVEQNGFNSRAVRKSSLHCRITTLKSRAYAFGSSIARNVGQGDAFMLTAMSRDQV
jgi:SAM-dependent methyltransferase